MSKVILITGASSGIGKATAQYLSQQGFIVYGTGRSPKSTEKSFIYLQLDITQKESIDQTISHIISKEGKLDVLINNAGMGITGPIEETPLEEMRKVFETNFFGSIEVMKSVLPVMRKQKDGHIINITSIGGYMGLPFRGVYSATKGALEVLSESVSMEVKEFGIKISNVAPGDFATNIAANRYHTPVFKDSVYKKFYQKNLELMDAHVDQGHDPLQLAKRILRIIEDPNPKLHYKVGEFMQKISIGLKRILPDRLFEKLMMKYYGM